MKALIAVPSHDFRPHELEMAMTPEFAELCKQDRISDDELRHFRDTPARLIFRVLAHKGYVRAQWAAANWRRLGWAKKHLVSAPASPPPAPKPKPKVRARAPKPKSPAPKRTIAPSSYKPRRILA
jgi:hypothetical protein